MDKKLKAFKQAMIYPSCVMAALVIFIIVALKFVFPNIIEILYELEVLLPWITRVLIQASEFVEHYWYTILATVFLGPIFSNTVCQIETAAYARDYCLLRLPFWGSHFESSLKSLLEESDFNDAGRHCDYGGLGALSRCGGQS